MFHSVFFPFPPAGMVKSHRIRFTSLMGVVDAPTAADNIIASLRRRAAIVFIPEIFYYVVNLVRVLPAKVLYRGTLEQRKMLVHLTRNAKMSPQLPRSHEARFLVISRNEISPANSSGSHLRTIF